MTAPIRRIAKLAALNCLALLLFGEVVARLVPLDVWLLRPLLYYQPADCEVHEPSEDPELLFQLKPGATLDAWGGAGAPQVLTPHFDRSGELNGISYSSQPRRVTVNHLGFRDPERQAKKPPGVFRIVMLGSSNTYGALVDDAQTVPAQLERLLNEHGGPVRFEVWNAGVSAYVSSQIVRVGRRILREFEPDLLLVQVYMTGRRAFIRMSPGTTSVRDKGPVWEGTPLSLLRSDFDRNPDLYWENLEYLPQPDSPPARWLLVHSSFYRTLVVAANRLPHTRNNADTTRIPANHRALAELARDHGGIPAFWIGVNPADANPPEEAATVLPRLFRVPRLPPSDSPEYLRIHPPAYVYAWDAEALRDELIARHLIPWDASEPPAGPRGLAVWPRQVPVIAGRTLVFAASGATGPLRWTLQSPSRGTLSEECQGQPTCVYTAGGIAGSTDTITVTDGNTTPASATVSVLPLPPRAQAHRDADEEDLPPLWLEKWTQSPP